MRTLQTFFAVVASVAICAPVARLAAQEPAVNPAAAAQAQFQGRLQAYLHLRSDLTHTLKPLSPTPNAAELAARQDSLAAALRTARAGAKAGDLVGPVSDLLRQTVAEDWKRRSPAARQGELEEVPNGPLPGINRPYPADAPFSTVPPLLLNALPRLPDNLQYRFYARHMVILDGDANIILDYVANVLPPH